jgi:hypothetical protein
MVPPTKQPFADFNADNIVKRKEIEKLEERVADLESRVGDDLKLAASIESVSKEANKFSDTINTCLIKLLNENEKAKDAIRDIVRNTDRNQWKIFVGKTWVAVWAIILMLIQALVQKFLS